MLKSTAFLNQLVMDLYRRAAGNVPLIKLPIRVIDSPKLADEIFKNSDNFTKNYPFLEKLSHGRLSTSGPEWEKRSKLTQVFYHQTTKSVSDGQLEEIYTRYLSVCLDGEQRGLKRALIRSAVEVISLSYGFKQSISWDLDLTECISEILREEQAIAWGVPCSLTAPLGLTLHQAYLKIKELWFADAQMKHFLARLAHSGSDIDQFDAVGELIQNVFAASETTASSLMWAVDILGRNPKYQEDLIFADDKLFDIFIDEVLRLYPPLPFVTRITQSACSLEGVDFHKGEQMLVSIVGINCHPEYWTDPLSFQFPRKEFVNGSYQNIAFKPFLSGPRVCGGMKLARRELRSGLKSLLKLYSIEKIDHPMGLEYGLTCRPITPLEQYLVGIHSL